MLNKQISAFGFWLKGYLVSAHAGVKLIGKIHAKVAAGGRVSALAEALAGQLCPGQHVLDIGCGDGSISALLKERVSDLRIQGIEFQARADCKIPCQPYDGARLPFPDASFDVCMLVDVLHHNEDVRVLLKEASRVSRSSILVKDHLAENFLDHLLLGIMDWVGNRSHGVPLPYNYLSREEWARALEEAGLATKSWTGNLPYYPGAAPWLGLRRLHFLSVLQKS